MRRSQVVVLMVLAVIAATTAAHGSGNVADPSADDGDPPRGSIAALAANTDAEEDIGPNGTAERDAGPDAPPALDLDERWIRVAPAVRRYPTPQPELRRELHEPWRWRLDLAAGADYLTDYYYRGFVRETRGLIIQPWSDLNLNVFNNPDGFPLNSVDLRVGLRTSHHWKQSVDRNTGQRWVELNWYGGFAVTVFDRLEFEALYVNREDRMRGFRNVHQADVTLRFDDRDPDYAWSLQPYATVTMEYENHSDAGWISPALRDEQGRFNVDDLYLELGVRPSVDLFDLHISNQPVTLELPARVGLSLNNYYTDTTGRDRTFGFASVGAHTSIPLGRVDAEPGRRFLMSLNLGVDVLYLGRSARDISSALGQGTRPFRLMGTVGLSIDF